MIEPQKAVHFRSILKLLKITNKIKYDIRFIKIPNLGYIKYLIAVLPLGYS